MDRGFEDSTAAPTGTEQFVAPMLLRRVRELPEGPEWQYEVKWDGYRMQAIKQGRSVRLISRNGADYTRRFAEVTRAVAALRPARLHLDGELVAMDPQGRPSFQALQSRGPLPPGWSFGLYAFDLLTIKGRDLRDQRLSERRSRLADLPMEGVVRFSATLKGSAEAVTRAVREQGLEGVVAKRLNSRYEPGKRSGAWLKLPLKQQSVFVIGGYRPGQHGIVLLVGLERNGHWVFAGKVRHGLPREFSKGHVDALSRLASQQCPFVNLPNCRADPFEEMVTPEEMDSFIWVRPEVRVVVAFSEWTRFDCLRHPEFVSLDCLLS